MTQANLEVQKSIAVFEHAKRREWGLGLLAWETKNKRGYVFENGQLRVLAEPFYALMQEVERPLDEVQALLKCLKPELDAARAEQGPSARIPRHGAASMTFEDQIAVFRAEYAGGFDDPRWIEKQRGTAGKKRAPTHRDSAIADMNQKLGEEVLKTRISEQAFRSIHEDLIGVLKPTDLVPAAELALLASTDPERQRALALMIAELLHGKIGFGTRFGQFLAAFQQAVGKPAGWQLATAFTSLLEPREQVCVRPTIFRAQAKLSAPGLSIPKLPTASSYARCLAMVKHLSTKLVDHGETPRDLMDVTDFIRVTTQPEARRKLNERKRAAP